ncbi:ABC transporter ATP-binding protein [Virgisporangium aurantiacum]|uniref:ABC transporter ATP-binding protein n=1 Tax=Virgisporangium aurantiacum TaxID=175570 RepID=A0A8J4DX35_9ACTN|nr:ABC transporter ATP-binding protein [Virgisporangium aurantiacum]GIJ54145.1 ABC transporter ATP-binding protein [Virgisporangium aurantiacum]
MTAVFTGVDLSRRFGTLTALHDVTCTVPSDARIAVTGPSGSGKSTLLHLVAGLDRPSGGTVAWPALAAHPRTLPGRVGVVFQAPSLLDVLDVRENVELPLLLGGRGVGTAADDALARLGLEHLAERLPHELSVGQAQRVAVARALAAGPQLLIADEPTAALDSATAAQVVDVLIAAADEASAALVVATHDPDVAGRFAERWRMVGGRIDRETPA